MVVGVQGLEPTFDVPIVNVTVVRGQIALLPCSIDFLGKYKATARHHGLGVPLSLVSPDLDRPLGWVTVFGRVYHLGM